MTLRGNHFDIMRLSAGNTTPTSSTASADFPHHNNGRYMNQPGRAPLAWLPRVPSQTMGAGDPVGCSPWLLDTTGLPSHQNAENILNGKPHPVHSHHQQQHHLHRMMSSTTSNPMMMSDFDPRLKQAMVGGGGGGNNGEILPHLFRSAGVNGSFETSANATSGNKWDSDMSDACIINTCLGGFSLNSHHQPPLLENGLSSFRLKDNNINENLFSAIDNGEFEGYSWPELTLTDDFNNQNGEIMGFHNPPAYEEDTKETPDDDRLMFLLLQLGIHRCPVLPDLRLHDNELDLYTVHH